MIDGPTNYRLSTVRGRLGLLMFLIHAGNALKTSGQQRQALNLLSLLRN